MTIGERFRELEGPDFPVQKHHSLYMRMQSKGGVRLRPACITLYV